jgi:hypothetical protein
VGEAQAHVVVQAGMGGEIYAGLETGVEFRGMAPQFGDIYRFVEFQPEKIPAFWMLPAG